MKADKRFHAFANVALILLVVYWGFRPNGPVTTGFLRYKEERSVHRLLDERWDEIVDVDARIGAHRGVPQLVEFIDYQCPSCLRAQASIADFLATQQDASIAVRHLPLTNIHPRAEAAARVSVCAEQHGRFRAVHDTLYALSSTSESEVDWHSLASVIGISEATLSSCMAATSTADRLAFDKELAIQLGIRVTPSFVGQNGIEGGVVTAERLAKLYAGAR